MFETYTSKEFEEGCVKIKFDPSSGKQRVTYVIDFGKTDLDPFVASAIIKEITSILRKELGLNLPDFK